VAAAAEAHELQHELVTVGDAHAYEMYKIRAQLHEALVRAAEAQAAAAAVAATAAAATAAAAAAAALSGADLEIPPHSSPSPIWGSAGAVSPPTIDWGGARARGVDAGELLALTGTLTSVVDASMRRETEADMLVALLEVSGESLNAILKP
jgi:phage-related tail fiber protein